MKPLNGIKTEQLNIFSEFLKFVIEKGGMAGLISFLLVVAVIISAGIFMFFYIKKKSKSARETAEETSELVQNRLVSLQGKANMILQQIDTIMKNQESKLTTQQVTEIVNDYIEGLCYRVGVETFNLIIRKTKGSDLSNVKDEIMITLKGICRTTDEKIGHLPGASFIHVQGWDFKATTLEPVITSIVNYLSVATEESETGKDEFNKKDHVAFVDSIMRQSREIAKEWYAR